MCVILAASSSGPSSATASPPRSRRGGECDSKTAAVSVPRPVNLIARNAHDIAGLTAVSPSVDEEINLSGHDIIHLLAVVLVRTCMIARRAFSEHETGIGPVNLLRS